MSQLSLIRSVDPLSLHSVEGWNAALRPLRCNGQAPAWQRGDVATPIMLAEGTLLVFADTFVKREHLRGLVRNSAVWVTPDGSVLWFSGPDHRALIERETAGEWWWPAGGIPAGRGEATLFGSLWRNDPTQPYGQLEGLAAVRVDVGSATVGELCPIDLPEGFTWGPPYLDWPLSEVVMAGFNPSTWEHIVARHTQEADTRDYSSRWRFDELTTTGSVSLPLGALSLRRLHGGVLASAKMLCSGPELGFEETPEIAAWWAPEPAGPYSRIFDLVQDTTRTDWRTYQGQAVELPHVGLCALHCANADWELPTYSPDGYGPTFTRCSAPDRHETVGRASRLI